MSSGENDIKASNGNSVLRIIVKLSSSLFSGNLAAYFLSPVELLSSVLALVYETGTD